MGRIGVKVGMRNLASFVRHGEVVAPPPPHAARFSCEQALGREFLSKKGQGEKLHPRLVDNPGRKWFPHKAGVASTMTQEGANPREAVCRGPIYRAQATLAVALAVPVTNVV